MGPQRTPLHGQTPDLLVRRPARCAARPAWPAPPSPAAPPARAAHLLRGTQLELDAAATHLPQGRQQARPQRARHRADEVQRQVQPLIGHDTGVRWPADRIAPLAQRTAHRGCRPQRDEQPQAARHAWGRCAVSLQRDVLRRLQRDAGASSSTTRSAIASDAVRPGDSMPNRLTRPGTPCAAGPSMLKSAAGLAGAADLRAGCRRSRAAARRQAAPASSGAPRRRSPRPGPGPPPVVEASTHSMSGPNFAWPPRSSVRCTPMPAALGHRVDQAAEGARPPSVK